MMVAAFQNIGITLIYAVSMAALFLHLYHGIQSSFQSVGWNNDRTIDAVSSSGKLVALVLFVGYLAIPLTILVRILK
jgi:succinate dehydrogenase / fumarate reductase cytochrome b subunit